MKEQEIRDKERLELLANIERMKKEDAKAAEGKRQRINMLMKQAAEANAQSLIEKEKRAEEEKNEEQQEQQQEQQVSREDAERILEALNNKEKDLQEKLKKKKVKAIDVQIEKDW